jgi:hypothetical protein
MNTRLMLVILILVVFAVLALLIPAEPNRAQTYPINTGIVPSMTPVPVCIIYLPVVVKGFDYDGH